MGGFSYCKLRQQDVRLLEKFMMLVCGIWRYRCALIFENKIQTMEQLVGGVLAFWEQYLEA